MVITKEPGDGILNTCTDSWAVYRGLTLWIAQWATQECTIHARPIWGKDIDQVNDLLSLVACLREEVERLRTIKDCEKEIDWWCQALSARRSRRATEAP